ncbi:potassium transporter [Psychrosphaera saromensis]|uniref:Potassium transporter n=1 Tax=Psychrosphaera saromensis TaxID=716813 RepID=A0A2S7URN6_9GAMM|nr:monovalent cation:proton antiporter-2 (CPA2) family protein [Psychrosphaera saromensis]PQJ52654.1 potassium transporter [Psychrosphaera saromensis]GHB70257.1 potassium transporter [Psychrosphaera saromensis]GLQ13136.1 potassium transporter [Psychrosphaera saromensis]
MEHGNLLFDAFIYLCAAVISVPIAKRLGLGSVLGYLVAGVLIGPFVLGFVGDQTDVMHFAEFGVVMMLFLVGLELKPSLLWKMRGPIVGTGGLQVLLSTAAITLFGMYLGLIWQQALAIGMVLALSSTAIVLQSLQEKGLMKTSAGQSAFAVLLFQDIAVIPMLAILPLLAVSSPELLVNSNSPHLGETGWVQGLIVVSVIAAIIFGGKYLMNPIFGFIAKSKLREIFTASALLLVIGVALAMQAIGLSPALGTFIAGVVLAESDFRHELESNIEPFKGLLLGLFFISVGAGINFALLFDDPLVIIGLTAALIVGKFLVLFILAKTNKLAKPDAWLFSVALAQGGEFAFVLFAFASTSGVLPTGLIGLLTLVVATSMLLTPLMLIANEKYISPRFATHKKPHRDADVIDEDNPIIVIGFGRFGQSVGRLLLANNISATVLDHDASQIEMVKKFGFKVYYGEGESAELLHSAGADTAKAIVVAVDDQESSLNIVHMVQKHFPHLKILVRAINRLHAVELHRLGVNDIERETMASGAELGAKALVALGWQSNIAYRKSRLFKKHDDKSVMELAAYDGDENEYISKANEAKRLLEETLKQDTHWPHEADEHAWEKPGKLK